MSATTVCSLCGYETDATPCARCGSSLIDLKGKPLRVGRGFALFDVWRGFWSLFASGLILFNRPEFACKLRAPFLANFLVLGVVFFGLFFGLWELFEWWISGSWGWFEWLRPAGSWVTGILSMLLAAVTLFLVSPVLIETVMGPFLDPLADVVEKIHGGKEMAPADPGAWKSVVAGVRSSAQILAIQIVILPLCLLLSLTGIGAILAILLAAILNAVVWFDIPLARRGLGLRYRLSVVRKNWPVALGFGLAFQFGLVIPFFNFLILTPAAAVSVSRLYLRFEKPQRFPAP